MQPSQNETVNTSFSDEARPVAALHSALEASVSAEIAISAS